MSGMPHEAQRPRLEPCPFCGGEAHVYKHGEGPALYSTFAYNIECDHLPECPISMSGGVVGDLDACSDDLDKLTEAWNRRTERTCAMTESHTDDSCTVRSVLDDGTIYDMDFGYKRCSECGAYVFDCPTVRYCPSCGARVVE